MSPQVHGYSLLFVVRKELPFALEHKLKTDSTRLEQPRPMSTRLSYPFSLHDLLAFGTEVDFAGTCGSLGFDFTLLYSHSSFISFFFSFFYLASSSKKR